MKKVIKFSLFILFFLIIFSQINVVGAEAGTTVSIPNPLGATTGTSIPILLGKVINTALSVVGSLALVMFVYGGITWMLSSGSPEQVTKGKNIFIWATVGLIIIFSAYALVTLVFTSMGVK
ncbi:MAG: pilin [Patescibacteria group bacterium]|nr:pilin [Patescibacteria group bacterium]MBU1870775.1 pilin [Patescibacteria group bacterium]